jgi:hypothetical protein
LHPFVVLYFNIDPLYFPDSSATPPFVVIRHVLSLSSFINAVADLALKMRFLLSVKMLDWSTSFEGCIEGYGLNQLRGDDPTLPFQTLSFLPTPPYAAVCRIH